MWPITPTFADMTRPRFIVATSVMLASIVTVGYFYLFRVPQDSHDPLVTTLRRHNAIRRNRRRNTSVDETPEVLAERPASSAGSNDDENQPRHPQQGSTEDRENEATGDWSSEENAWDEGTAGSSIGRAGHNIVGLLFRVSEDNARRSALVHRGCQCNSCSTVPIRGIRYRCANCADFDLCEVCESMGVHNKAHVFYKIRVPVPPSSPRTIQPVLYPGDPENCSKTLPKAIINRLSHATGFDRTSIEAYWERWTFLANTEWRDDPDDLCIAMDRKTFDRCVVHSGNGGHFPPNLVHDRMFAFFDQDNDGLISFREYLMGSAYRNSKDKLRRVFNGYDIDGDGYVDRKDFLRMFRAYYSIFKQIHKDILAGIDAQVSSMTEVQHIVNGRTPLSGFFGREENMSRIDRRNRGPIGKRQMEDGSMQLEDGAGILDQRSDMATRDEILKVVFSVSALQKPNSRAQNMQNSLSSALLNPPSDVTAILGLLTSFSNDSLPPVEGDSKDNENSDAKKHALEARVRKHMHDRWKKRMFYLDQEEGGATCPPGASEDDGIVEAIQAMVNPAETRGSGFSSDGESRPRFTRSRSSSKVRFVDENDDEDEELETRSNASTSSRSIPERWGGVDIPDAERDFGKEVLYLTAQEAYNELLDGFFKAKEDWALKAAESREERSAYRRTMETGSQGVGAVGADSTADSESVADAPNDDRFTSVEEEDIEGSSLTYRDPTMPQFRPDNQDDDSTSAAAPATPAEDALLNAPGFTIRRGKKAAGEVSATLLQKWKKHDDMELEVVQRKGVGKLNYEEFERIYRSSTGPGKRRLDWLDTWLDICMI